MTCEESIDSDSTQPFFQEKRGIGKAYCQGTQLGVSKYGRSLKGVVLMKKWLLDHCNTHPEMSSQKFYMRHFIPLFEAINLCFRLVQIMNFEWPDPSQLPDTLGPPPVPDMAKPVRLGRQGHVWATKWQCSLGRNENMSPVEASKISVFQLIWTINILTSHQVIQWTTKTGIHMHNYHIFIIFDMICIYPISQANVFKLNLHIMNIYIYIFFF